MSDPPTNVAFKIINAQSMLPLHLSDEDDKSIVGGVPLPVPDLRQQWFVRSSSDGTFTLESAFNGQSIGFEGAMTEGADLVTGDPSVAKDWVFQRMGPVDYIISLPGPFFCHRDAHSDAWDSSATVAEDW